jgi:hypothetical protein
MRLSSHLGKYVIILISPSILCDEHYVSGCDPAVVYTCAQDMKTLPYFF